MAAVPGLGFQVASLVAGGLSLSAIELHLHRAYASAPLFAKNGLLVPRLFGVVLINATMNCLTMIYLGGSVGHKRNSYIEKATEEGDENAEARYGLPKLYAEGFGELAKEFNCLQRGHQGGLETFPHFLMCSFVAGVKQPITASAMQILWMVSRISWAKGYATGEPKNRYKSKWAIHVWTSLFTQTVLALSTALQICAGV